MQSRQKSTYSNTKYVNALPIIFSAIVQSHSLTIFQLRLFLLTHFVAIVLENIL